MRVNEKKKKMANSPARAISTPRTVSYITHISRITPPPNARPAVKLCPAGIIQADMDARACMQQPPASPRLAAPRRAPPLFTQAGTYLPTYPPSSTDVRLDSTQDAQRSSSTPRRIESNQTESNRTGREDPARGQPPGSRVRARNRNGCVCMRAQCLERCERDALACPARFPGALGGWLAGWG
jgi:hypothetical protein